MYSMHVHIASQIQTAKHIASAPPLSQSAAVRVIQAETTIRFSKKAASHADVGKTKKV